MCRYFAVALARRGVTVNAVSPGASGETTVIGQTPKEVKRAEGMGECGLDAVAKGGHAVGCCEG
jgi:NAD(P)-dependent dehydrogenase (short-subunit alcohol dehydrogenase family)